MNAKSLWDTFTDELSFLPIHPQYFVKKYNYTAIDFALKYAKGVLLDVGCGRMPYRKHILPRVEKYIGLDYPKTAKFYHGEVKPDIYGDATNIPLPDNSCDTVLLLQVLEHLPQPEKAMAEIQRVLKAGGMFIVSTVHMYPLHDEPYDFFRFTKYGLRSILKTNGFKVVQQQQEGNVFVLQTQGFNIFLMLGVKDLLKRGWLGKIIAFLVSPFVISITTLINVLTFPLTLVDTNSKFGIIITAVAKKI